MAAVENIKRLKESLSKPKTGDIMREVEFVFHAPEAKSAYIAGKFNSWNTSSTPMKKFKDGTWRTKLKLSPGKYEYKYFVDNAWVSDLTTAELVPNPFGTDNSVITVK